MSTEPVIRFGHSPDADDAFMFYGIKSGRVDTEGLRLVDIIEDIESLNHRALQGELEATAVSVHCYSRISDIYYLMPHGVSMGEGYGPVLVARAGTTLEELKGQAVASPGELTTASLVARLALPGVELVDVPFDEIIPKVKAGEYAAGIIIHEGQVTYEEEGLLGLLDLGEWWQEKTGLPLPLGVDVIRRDLPMDIIQRVVRVFKHSIEYGLIHREEALEYAMQYGRGISTELADRFVAMYVNRRTVDMGSEGRLAIRRLLEEAYKAGLIEVLPDIKFTDEL